MRARPHGFVRRRNTARGIVPHAGLAFVGRKRNVHTARVTGPRAARRTGVLYAYEPVKPSQAVLSNDNTSKWIPGILTAVYGRPF